MPGGFLTLYGRYGPSMRTSRTLLAQMSAFVTKNADDMNRRLAFFLRHGEMVLDVLAATDDTNCSEVHVFIAAMMDHLHIQILNRSGFWGTYGNPPPLPAGLPSLAMASYSMAFLGSGQFVLLEYVRPQSPPRSPPTCVATRSRVPHQSLISSQELEEAMGMAAASSLHAAIESPRCTAARQRDFLGGLGLQRRGAATPLPTTPQDLNISVDTDSDSASDAPADQDTSRERAFYTSEDMSDDEDASPESCASPASCGGKA